MQVVKAELSWVATAVFVVAICTIAGREQAEAQLHWPSPQKEELNVRLIALVGSYPRSSFFSSFEVFVAEKQMGHEESRLIKLVYGFLPYQPRLSDYGLDYSTVHELRATRDPSCDENLSQITSKDKFEEWVQTSRAEPKEMDLPEKAADPPTDRAQQAAADPPPPDQPQATVRYSIDSPGFDLDRKRANLPCYHTDPEDYSRSIREPVSVPYPELATRPQLSAKPQN